MIVVTGASMGIGEAIAKAFVDEGASVCAACREMRARAEAARRAWAIRSAPWPSHATCGHREEIDRVISLTLHHFGRIDVWVNNAGHGLIDSVAQMDMNALRGYVWRRTSSAQFPPCKLCLPVMKQQNQGTVINISSVGRSRPAAIQFRVLGDKVRPECD